MGSKLIAAGVALVIGVGVVWALKKFLPSVGSKLPSLVG
jgi:hypothetical protein